MSSAAQIEANRANAQHSTGPRTEEGKLASSANSTREGLTSTRIIVRPGEEDRYQSLRDTLFQELSPEGEFQRHYFEVIVHAVWNIQRCIALEGELQLQSFEADSLDAMLDDALSTKLDRLYRYKKMHENSQRKAVAELRRLQSEQMYRCFQHPTAIDSGILMDSAKVDSDVGSAQKRRPIFFGSASAAFSADVEELQNEAELSSLLDPPGDQGVEYSRRYLENIQQQRAAAAA